MTLEDLADLISANSANTNGRIEALRNETNSALMNIQNDLTDVRAELSDVRTDLTDVRAEVAQVRRSLDLTSVISTMQRQIDALSAEVAELKRRAS